MAARVGLALFLASLQVGATPLFQQEGLEDIVTRFRSRASNGDRLELGRSILKRLESAPNEALKSEVHLSLGLDLVALERFGEAREHLEVSLDLARKREDSTTLAHSAWELGVVAFHLGDFDQGIDWAAEGADAAESIGRNDMLWRCANIKGLIEERAGDYEAALDSFAHGLEAAEESSDIAGTATLHANLGIAQMNIGELDLAYGSFMRARELQTGTEDVAGLASTLANLGDVSFLLAEYADALTYHHEALALREELGSEVELALSYHSLGAIHFAEEEYDLALERFEEALEMRRRLELIPEQAVTLLAMARVYAALDEADLATESALASAEIADDLDMLGRRLGVLEALAEVYEQQGKHVEALEVSRTAWEFEREQRSQSARRKFARFESELATKAQSREIALLTKEAELRNLELKRESQARNFLLVGSVLLSAAALAGWAAWALLRRTHRALRLANAAAQKHSDDLEAALNRIKRLEGLLPICSYCKSIRDEQGAWHAVETYVTGHSEAHFTHSICPSCMGDCLTEAGLPTPLRSEPR